MEKKLWFVGFALLSVPFICYLLLSIVWLCGGVVNSYIFPAAFILSLLLYYIATAKQGRKDIMIGLLSIMFMIPLCCLIAYFAWDTSWDGHAYHQTIIYSLMDGWNPVYGEAHSYCYAGNTLYVNSYAKGIESIAACIASTCNNLECGKAVNLIFLASSFFLSLGFLNDFLPNSSIVKRLLYSAIIAFSPVVACQMFTFYIDWALYIIVLDIALVLYRVEKHGLSFWEGLSLFMLLSLAIPFKFNIAFWGCLVVGLYWISLVIRKQYKQVKAIVYISVFSMLLGFCVLGFNPFIKNILNGHHPCYPVAGAGSEHTVEVINKNAPDIYKTNGPIKSIFISLSARPSSSGEYHNPYVVKKIDFINSGYPDNRMGGFGFFSLEIFVLTLITILLYRKKEKNYYIFLLIESLLFVSLFILPWGWWARFVAFFYLFPIISVLYAEKYEKSKCLKNILNCLLIANMVISIGTSSYMCYRISDDENKSIKILEDNQPALIKCENDGFYFKLLKRDIQLIPCDTVTLRLPVTGPDVFVDKTLIKK